jgi:hypothetical protein
MGRSQLLEVLQAQAFAAPIARMGRELKLGLLHPAAKGFGINGKPTTTVGRRNEGHGATPFVV